MNFETFWKDLQIELQRISEFETLARKKKFTARFERKRKTGDLFVRIIPESGILRGPIQQEFRAIWDNAKIHSHETRFKNKDGRLSPYPKLNGGTGSSLNISYITTLIKHIVKDQNMK